MKKIILMAVMAVSYLYVGAQCTPDYDFGGETYGVSPDPNQGESFDQGVINEPYEDVIHIIVPTNAGDVNELFDGFTVDSLTLDSVTVTIDDVQVHLIDIGLDILCNNLGDSPDPCTFMGGEQYCAAVQGTPTVGGVLPLQIHITGYVNVLGTSTPVSQAFDQYELVIDDGTLSIGESKIELDYLGQNVPNPFAGKTKITYSMGSAGNAKLIVSNVIGDIVYSEVLQGSKGANTIEFDGSQYGSGIYLYSIETSGRKITKRMVIR